MHVFPVLLDPIAIASSLIIGKGFDYYFNGKAQYNIERSLVQTYGEPASDNLLTARSGALNYPQLGIGRLAACT